MNRDIRKTALYEEVNSFFRAIHMPGQDSVSDAADVCVEPKIGGCCDLFCSCLAGRCT